MRQRAPISALDDYPIHQTSQPVRYVATSDHNFYDRYYFNIGNRTSEVFGVFGLGVYPNLGVMDAFFSFRVGSKYQVVRSSKALGPDRSDMQVGPISIKIIEPLQSLQFIVEPNKWGLDAELTWTSRMAPYFSSPRVRRDDNGHMTHDHCRFDQTGNWAGTINFGDQQFTVEPTGWPGTRDRSWGVRPIGDYAPQAIGTRDPGGVPGKSHFWNYAPALFDDFSLVYIVEELGDGTRTLEDAVLIPSDGSPIVELGRAEHELTFAPGTRDVTHATIRFTSPTGQERVMEVTPLIPIWIFVGTGYRAVDHWRHGKYQGPLAVEGVSYDLNDADDARLMTGVVDAAARFEIDGRVGYGLWESIVAGPNSRYNF